MIMNIKFVICIPHNFDSKDSNGENEVSTTGIWGTLFFDVFWPIHSAGTLAWPWTTTFFLATCSTTGSSSKHSYPVMG